MLFPLFNEICTLKMGDEIHFPWGRTFLDLSPNWLANLVSRITRSNVYIMDKIMVFVLWLSWD